MNTTTLIAQWTMHGASSDAVGSFRATDDILALFESGTAPPTPSRVTGSLLVKRVGEDHWRPLTGNAE